jgi:hypothetical protein
MAMRPDVRVGLDGIQQPLRRVCGDGMEVEVPAQPRRAPRFGAEIVQAINAEQSG